MLTPEQVCLETLKSFESWVITNTPRTSEEYQRFCEIVCADCWAVHSLNKWGLMMLANIFARSGNYGVSVTEALGHCESLLAETRDIEKSLESAPPTEVLVASSLTQAETFATES